MRSPICFCLFILLQMAEAGDWHGQVAGTIGLSHHPQPFAQGAVRAVPGMSLELGSFAGGSVDMEGTLELAFDCTEPGDGCHLALRPYRLWLRCSEPQWELRLGLQQINFGSAFLLRPLMWFDRLDVRNPLQLTEGVPALLFRYYFLNNTVFWLWGIAADGDSKGWEAVASKKNTLEAGGRLEVPLFTGQLALTLHHRSAEWQDPGSPATEVQPEERLGLDGKWDVGIGCWFEAVIEHRHFAWMARIQRSFCIGSDYTFAVGNGVHFLIEYLNLSQSDCWKTTDQRSKISAFAIDYPLTLIDQIACYVALDSQSKDLFWTAIWQQVHDNWKVSLIGFINPDYALTVQTASASWRGKGVQMVLIHHF